MQRAVMSHHESDEASADRRSRVRFYVRPSVTLDIRKEGANRAVLPLDISEVGVRAIAKAPLELNDKVEISLYCKERGETIKRSATVCWVSQLAMTNHVKAGFRFDNPLLFQDLVAFAKP